MFVLVKRLSRDPPGGDIVEATGNVTHARQDYLYGSEGRLPSGPDIKNGSHFPG